MTRQASSPPWLAELQARFSSVLRTPLDRASGTLRASTSLYASDAIADVIDRPGARAADRLAVYNRQYWFRLFDALSTAYALTARLVGYFRFNELAAAFLIAHPPRGWDLERVGDGLPAFLADALGALDIRADEREALCEAARIDVAWRAVFVAPPTPTYRPRPEDGAGLLDARLAPSPATAIISEHWPLLALKRALAQQPGEGRVPLPARLDAPQSWALVREPSGIRWLALAPQEAALFRLLAEHTVRDALARLEEACTPDERAALPALTQRWLARSVALGLWSALAP